MNIVLLAGGSGKLLWPLSNGVRSKQFIRIFRTPDGDRESMLQRVCRQVRQADPSAAVTIATSKSQVSAVRHQLGDLVNLCVEPCRRDTFPAIALAAAYMHDVQGIGLNEAVVFCPVDPYVQDDYFDALQRLWKLAGTDTAHLVLMGIDPTYPSEKYGYILPVSADPVAKVKAFREKPDAATAERYIESGGLWNGGVFACRLRYVLERAHELIDFADYHDLLNKYDSVQKISFDYAVVEQEKDIAVLRFSGEWRDIGTWNTLTDVMEEPSVGDVRMDETCRNVHAVNELDIPVLAMGLEDAVIAASPEGILVSSRKRSGAIKPLVDGMNRPVMFAEKSWGSYRVLDAGENNLTVRLTLLPGRRMSFHFHDRRDEVWTVVSGSGRAFVDGTERNISLGDVVLLPAGSRHTVTAGEKGLELIEIQVGRDISAGDKHKFD